MDLEAVLADFDIVQYNKSGFITIVLDTVGSIYNSTRAEESFQAWLPLFDQIQAFAPIMGPTESEVILNFYTLKIPSHWMV